MSRFGHLLGFWASVALAAIAGGTLAWEAFTVPLGAGSAGAPGVVLQRAGIALIGIGAAAIVASAMRSQPSVKSFMTTTGMLVLGSLLALLMTLATAAPGSAMLPIAGLLLAGGLLVFGAELQPVAPRAMLGRRVAWLAFWALLLGLAFTTAFIFAAAGLNWYITP